MHCILWHWKFSGFFFFFFFFGEMVLIVVIFWSSWGIIMQKIFCAYGHLNIFASVQNSSHFYFLLIKSYAFLMQSRHKLFFRSTHWEHVCLNCSWSFYFFNKVFKKQEFFNNLDEIQLFVSVIQKYKWISLLVNPTKFLIHVLIVIAIWLFA